MKSMTGYGEASAEADIGTVQIDIRSENHRYLDIKVYSPEFLNCVEGFISEEIRKNVTRGKLRVRLSVQENRKKKNQLLVNHFSETFDTLKKIRKDLKIDEQVSLHHLLLMKEFFDQDISPDISEAAVRKITAGVNRAIKEFNKTRNTEGKELQKDIAERIKNLRELVKQIKNTRTRFSEDSQKKLREKVENLIGDIEIDESRLVQEIAFLTERSEITEELVRLDAHISKFNKNIKKAGAIGKELDFLVQEMNREAATISAKCKDAEISHITIELRSELEKIREQIQNIE